MAFQTEKQNLLVLAEQFKEAYNNFTKNVSPKHWRTVGSNWVDLNDITKDIQKFEEADEEERNTEFFKEQTK